MKLSRIFLFLCLFLGLMCVACGDASDEQGSEDGFLDAEDNNAVNNEQAPNDDVTPDDEQDGDEPDGEIPDVIDEGEDDGDRPALDMGPNDALAQAACALMDASPQAILAVADESDAGQVLVTPSESELRLVTLPDTGVGFITLEVPEWSIVIGAGVDYTQSVTILDPGSVTERTLALSWNGACPDLGLTDQRTKFHSWGSFTVELTGEPGDDVLLSFIKAQ